MLRPLGDVVLIKAIVEAEESHSGLIIPSQAKDKPSHGCVCAAGPDAVRVKQGDKVLYGKYAGTEIKLGGQDYLIMHQDDILGVLED